MLTKKRGRGRFEGRERKLALDIGEETEENRDGWVV